MESILQTIDGSKMFSLLDGFSGYNQIMVQEEDQHKTTFTTKCGTFTYSKISFSLSNVGVTFQRAMDVVFKELTNKIILIYLDDLIVFSKSKDDHFDHLEMVFQKCQEFRISLNPKKCVFRVPKGKFLEHVVSKDGIAIDLDRVTTIKDISLPVNKKGFSLS